eukprot:4337970-Alexandrium_andersonii.AAC.1
MVGTVVDSLSNGVYDWQLFHVNPPEFPDWLHGGFADCGCWACRMQWPFYKFEGPGRSKCPPNRANRIREKP